MNTNALIFTDEAREGFYPTPPKMAEKLMEGLDWDTITNVLEPSAGKGNLIHQIACAWNRGRFSRRWHYERSIEVDCIEIDPYLRSILQYEYGGKHEEEIRYRLRVLREKEEYNCVTRCRGELTPAEKEEKADLELERDRRHYTNLHIIHDNFLTFSSRKSYDLILMNPPFSDGDAHLLKAIDLQSRDGGKIRCILNADTLLNPYTNRRKILKQKLEELDAEISFVEGGFSDGERKTDVSTAIIKIDIPTKRAESQIYERLRKAAEIETEPAPDVTDLTVADFLSQIVTRFNVEVDAGLALIREYKAMQPYILESLDKDDKYNYANLTLYVGHENRGGRGAVPNPNDFVRLTRRKYWEALFSNKDFVGKLTSNLREKYRNMVGEMENYDFTLFNIQQVIVEMNAEMNQGIQDTIVALFERMTVQHSWYPETAKNIHYYNGWKTNKVHKINKKVILPVHGMFSDYSWEKNSFRLSEAESTIGDIEKVFDYLDGNMSASVDLHGVLSRAHEMGQTRNIPCKYFDVTLYKKGTMHIVFRNLELLERFNIYCARKKAWLPPNYGRTAYDAMTKEERDVVDGFNGNGTEGSGAAAYGEIITRQAYYLSEPTQELPKLVSAI